MSRRKLEIEWNNPEALVSAINEHLKMLGLENGFEEVMALSEEMARVRPQEDDSYLGLGVLNELCAAFLSAAAPNDRRREKARTLIATIRAYEAGKTVATINSYNDPVFPKTDMR